ncbi:MAG: sigma-54-dependent Fis family transcriptional regulator, partial [Proteobacteria bacterium]
IGESPSIQKVKDLIVQFGRRDAKVLITGDTGTGKELVAHGIWRSSARSKKAFVLINAAAIPETLIESELFGHQKGAFTGAVSNQLGKLEMADGGTVFLDEIGELSLMAQSKLLRFLETGEIQVLGSNKLKQCDVRLIAATSRDLPAEIKAGRFREDLYFRLNVARIEIAPLRQRREDILPIFVHFVATVCGRYGEPIRDLEESAKSALMSYPWPGNVRELRNVAERAVLLSAQSITRELIIDILGSGSHQSEGGDDLPKSLEEVVHLKDFRKKAETRYVGQVIKLADGSVTRAAQVLGVDRSHLHQKLKDLGLA